MSNLHKLFEENINNAIISAGVMTDVNQKPMAFAAIAQALATFLQGNNTVTTNTVEPVNEVSNELEELQKKNKEVATAINETITKTEEVTEQTVPAPVVEQQSAPAPIENKNTAPAPIEPAKDEWVLPIDENGIPYLNQEDFAVAERVLAYEAAMTPEIQAKKRELEIAAGQKVLNEPIETQAPVATTQAPAKEFTPEQLQELENYKTTFDYANNPTILDNLYLNFTAGVQKTLAELTPDTAEAFLHFIKDELAKAYTAIEAWKNSWITKEGLDKLIAEAYQDPNATLETHLYDGNIFWFLEHIELYNANCWLNSYKQEMSVEQLNAYVAQCYEDPSLTIDSITDEFVVGFVNFIQQVQQQTA